MDYVKMHRLSRLGIFEKKVVFVNTAHALAASVALIESH
jgi:hypothetical protein